MRDHNIRTDEVEAFVRWLRRHFPKCIILVLNRLAAHRSAATDDQPALVRQASREALRGALRGGLAPK